jgi:hypothetical protein
VAVSASHLDSARTAFNANDCAAATRESRSSLDWLGRPEPWEIIAFCRAAEPGAPGALAAISEAAERDPHNWRYRYSRGLIRAAAGQDPKADLESAHAINPVERDVIEGLEELRTLKRSQWRRWGLESPLPTD